MSKDEVKMRTRLRRQKRGSRDSSRLRYFSEVQQGDCRLDKRWGTIQGCSRMKSKMQTRMQMSTRCRDNSKLRGGKFSSISVTNGCLIYRKENSETQTVGNLRKVKGR